MTRSQKFHLISSSLCNQCKEWLYIFSADAATAMNAAVNAVNTSQRSAYRDASFMLRRYSRLSAHVISDLQHFIGGLDDLRIRFIRALRDDQVENFLDDLHV